MKILLVVALGLSLVGCATTSTTSVELDQPLSAEIDSDASAKPASTASQSPTWLHVKVSSKFYIIKQTAKAVAWTTSDKAGKRKKKVQEIRLALDCYDRHDSTKRNTDTNDDAWESEWGFPWLKENKTARATAWSKGPKIGPLDVWAKPGSKRKNYARERSE